MRTPNATNPRLAVVYYAIQGELVVGSRHDMVPAAQFPSTFRGHNSHAIRFWSAGALPPFRFWPAGTTEKEWQSWCLEHPTHEPRHTNPHPRDKTRYHKNRSIAKTRPKHHTRKQHVNKVNLATPTAEPINSVPDGGANEPIDSMPEGGAATLRFNVPVNHDPVLNNTTPMSHDPTNISSRPSMGHVQDLQQPRQQQKITQMASQATEKARVLIKNEQSDYFDSLHKSFEHPNFGAAMVEALAMASLTDDTYVSSDGSSAGDANSSGEESSDGVPPWQEMCNRVAIPELTTSCLPSNSCSPAQVDSLADALHDSAMYTQRRLQKKWNDWVSMELIHKEMHGLVPRGQAELWDGWTGPEQLEACMAFAMVFVDLGVMAINWDTNELRFLQRPRTGNPVLHRNNYNYYN